MIQQFLQLSPEVQHALKMQKPIIALQSSLITHGLPYPDNLCTAKLLEQLIREQGAVPAIIALNKGKIHIGLNEPLLQYLANSKNIFKASKRDIALVLSRNEIASTTLAAALFCAHLSGLMFFVTGGIGGHANYIEEDFDIAADLTELTHTPIIVICSGAKSILDLPSTLKPLQSHGITVIGYKTDEFPSFYSHARNRPLIHRMNNLTEIAKLIRYQRQLGPQGLVIVNPTPKSAEIAEKDINGLFEKAQKEIKSPSAKAITPLLLQRISALTANQNLLANIELFKANTLLAARIALAYQQQR